MLVGQPAGHENVTHASPKSGLLGIMINSIVGGAERRRLYKECRSELNL
jgi:hypothetical protein